MEDSPYAASPYSASRATRSLISILAQALVIMTYLLVIKHEVDVDVVLQNEVVSLDASVVDLVHLDEDVVGDHLVRLRNEFAIDSGSLLKPLLVVPTEKASKP